MNATFINNRRFNYIAIIAGVVIIAALFVASIACVVGYKVYENHKEHEMMQDASGACSMALANNGFYMDQNNATVSVDDDHADVVSTGEDSDGNPVNVRCSIDYLNSDHDQRMVHWEATGA